MVQNAHDSKGSDGTLLLPMPLLHERFDSTRRQGTAYGGREESKQGLYFAGDGPAKEIIGVGKFRNYPIESVVQPECFLSLVQEKRPEFYVIEGAGRIGDALLRNFLDAIAGAYSGGSSPTSVSIVESEAGLVRRLELEYGSIHFYRARAIGQDAIDAGLPSHLHTKSTY